MVFSVRIEPARAFFRTRADPCVLQSPSLMRSPLFTGRSSSLGRYQHRLWYGALRPVLVRVRRRLTASLALVRLRECRSFCRRRHLHWLPGLLYDALCQRVRYAGCRAKTGARTLERRCPAHRSLHLWCVFPPLGETGRILLTLSRCCSVVIFCTASLDRASGGSCSDGRGEHRHVPCVQHLLHLRSRTQRGSSCSTECIFYYIILAYEDNAASCLAANDFIRSAVSWSIP